MCCRSTSGAASSCTCPSAKWGSCAASTCQVRKQRRAAARLVGSYGRFTWQRIDSKVHDGIAPSSAAGSSHDWGANRPRWLGARVFIPQCTGVNVDEVFTTDQTATPVSVASWGFLGDTWPFFRPNFVNMDKHREERRAEEVGSHASPRSDSCRPAGQASGSLTSSLQFHML